MTTFARDLRFAVRSLLGAPNFAVATVITLGLGMTLFTTAMVVAKAYLLHALPYPAAERLFAVRYSTPGQQDPRGMDALDWSSLNDVIEHPIAWDLDVFYMLGGEHAESIPGAWVTPGFVEGLGIRPALGRGFDRESFAPGGTNVVLISHKLWTSRFAGDPQVVGRTFTAYVSDRPDEAERYTIIGVMPAGFWHINSYTDILTPLRARTYPYLVRLRAGVTPEAAARRITALVSAGAREVPRNWQAQLVASHEGYVQSVRPAIRFISGAAVLVLLVACGNVAALMLVRATRRQKEIAVRTALGAGRLAIARMLVAEAVVVGAVATGAAVWITGLLIRWLAPLIEIQLGRLAPGGAAAFAVDLWFMGFAAAVGVATAVARSLAPLVTSTRPVQDALQSGSRTATESRRSQRIRSALITVEIAVSLALLAGSLLMLRSVIRLLDTNLGFDASRVVNASITLRQNRYPTPASRLAVFDRMIARLSEIPGAESVALTTAWPVQQPRLQPIGVAGDEASAFRAAVHGVSARYFSTLNIPLAAGRGFQDSDRVGSEQVAVVSRTAARRLSPSANPIGTRVLIPEEQDRGERAAVLRTVVGIAEDVRQTQTDDELGDVYVPLLQAPGRFAFGLMRTSADLAATAAAFQSAFRDIDPEISVFRAGPLQARVDDLTLRPRFMTSLLAAFAGAAALLALVGVYSVVAYAVRQREREIAIRTALGADPARLTRFFVRQGSFTLAAGLGLGVLAVIVVGRVMESQLFGVTPRDPLSIGAAVLAFGAAGFLAIWWPSRRAASTHPAIALRAE
jgi:putative ABC transport system permease protein